MDGLWEILSGWSGFGQGLFLLILLGGFFALIRQIAYYISVSFRGWPPPGTALPTDNENEEIL